MRELVGQGKPFYSALDKAAGLLRRKVGTGSEFLKELMSIPGVKQAEIAERGLGELLNAPKMTHEQFMAALGTKPAPAIGEKVLGEQVKDNKVRNQAWDKAYEDAIDSLLDNGLSPDQARQEALELADERINRYLPEGETQEHRTHHGQWTLPGGENYREMLIKAPAPRYSQNKIMEVEAKLRRAAPNMVKHYTDMLNVMKKDAGQNEQFPGVPQHFGGEPGILASMRLKDRKGPNGEKLLHLEELQSDWHQQGREKGYKGENNKIEYDDPVYENARQIATHYLNEFNRNNDNPARQAEILPLLTQAQEVERTFTDHNNRVYKQVPDAPFKKNWEEMALKRLIHHAAENGYHGVVVTPGAEQADRYSLAKHISGVDYIRNELKPQRNEMIAYDPYGNVIFNEFGVTPEKLEQHIGKEAAQKLLSQEAQPNNYGLPTHSLRGEQLVVGGEGMKAFYDKKVPNILNGIGKKYGVKTELGGHKIDPWPEDEMDRNAVEQYKGPTALHYFPITEEMRQDVKKNGIPLYKSGGIVSTH